MKITKGKYTVNCSLCNRLMGYSPHNIKRTVLWCFECDKDVRR
jgi:hypothetical protein